MAGTGPVRLYLDYISPYAHLAWAACQRLTARTGRTLVPEPVLFAGLLNHHGQLGPAEVAPKRAYIFRDVVRKATLAGLPECLPVRPPPTHPFRPLLPLRVTGCPTLTPTQRAQVVSTFFQTVWRDGHALETEADVARALARAVPDVDVGAVLAEARTDAAKDRLRLATEAALKAGVFGVYVAPVRVVPPAQHDLTKREGGTGRPTMVVDGTLFWGTDALPALEALLTTGVDPAAAAAQADAVRRWDAIRPSAQRRPGVGPAPPVH